MPTLSNVVTEKFIAALRESGALSETQLAGLAVLLSKDPSKLKTDALISLFNEPPGGDVK